MLGLVVQWRYERVLHQVVEAHRDHRYVVHRRPDADRLLHRHVPQAVRRLLAARSADHRPAHRHGHPIPDPFPLRRLQRLPQGGRQGRRRSDLQQAAAPGHHPAWLQAQPAGAVHAGHQVPADRGGHRHAGHRRDLSDRPCAQGQPDARHPDRGRHRHLRRCRRHGTVGLHHRSGGGRGGEGRQRGDGRGHRGHHGHDLRADRDRAVPGARPDPRPAGRGRRRQPA